MESNKSNIGIISLQKSWAILTTLIQSVFLKWQKTAAVASSPFLRRPSLNASSILTKAQGFHLINANNNCFWGLSLIISNIQTFGTILPSTCNTVAREPRFQSAHPLTKPHESLQISRRKRQYVWRDCTGLCKTKGGRFKTNPYWNALNGQCKLFIER